MCHFQFFQLFRVILTLKFFSKKQKLRVQYFFGTPFNILREKKMGGGQNLERRIANIKITNDELFDSFIIEFTFFIFHKLF